MFMAAFDFDTTELLNYDLVLRAVQICHRPFFDYGRRSGSKTSALYCGRLCGISRPMFRSAEPLRICPVCFTR